VSYSPGTAKVLLASAELLRIQEQRQPPTNDTRFSSSSFRFKSMAMGASTDRGRKREEHNEVRWPHLPVQRPPAATRSPPPLRRHCTLLLLLLSRPIPAGTATETASAHPKTPEQGRSEKSAGGRAHRPRAVAQPPIRRDP